MDQIIASRLDELIVPQMMLLVGFQTMLMMSKFQHTNASSVQHVRKSTPHREESLFSKWSIILSLKLVSIPHSCPRMSDQCDVITPPICKHSVFANSE
jgi:hypothetical protein